MSLKTTMGGFVEEYLKGVDLSVGLPFESKLTVLKVRKN